MQKLVLLVVGAVWLAVLVPPLLRSRGESRPNSSVDHFRRNLSILQKTTPSRMHSMQSMARPLAGGRPGADQYARAAMRRGPSDPRLRRVNYTASPTQEQRDHTAHLQRRTAARPHTRRELLRQRREQMVRVLLFMSLTTMVLAFLAKSPMLVYVCALCWLSLIGYCAMLLRIRRDAELYAMEGWERAA